MSEPLAITITIELLLLAITITIEQYRIPFNRNTMVVNHHFTI